MRKLFILVVLIVGFLAGPTPTMAQNYSTLFSAFRADGLTRDDKRFLQAALAFEGHYNGLLDGDWGRLSQTAFEAYSRKEFGTGAEDWHMAVLAASFFELYKRDGWKIRHFDVLGMSMLFPEKAVVSDAASENFVNWRHTNSSLSYSFGIHNADMTNRIHTYTVSTHNSGKQIYTLRRENFAITSATQNDGSVLYTRSNYINGAWHTVMLSARRYDIPILNAVAASINVGYSRQILFTANGKLNVVIDQVIALSNESNETERPQPEASSVSQPPGPQSSTGTGFAVSDKGYILTNAHVVKDCTSTTFSGLSASVVAVSADYDLALLYVPKWVGTSVAQFSPTPARLNSDVTVAGFPLSGILSGLNVTRGAVSSQMGFGGDVGGMQITAPVQPGNSGGPVIASDGEVVGVVVSKLDAQVVADAIGDIPQNVNFAIRGELAKLFLFQHGVEPIIGTSDEILSPVDLAERASSYTGIIKCN